MNVECVFEIPVDGGYACKCGQIASTQDARADCKLHRENRCAHLGDHTGEFIVCRTCRGNVKLKIMACGVHVHCTTGKRVAGLECCPCDSYVPVQLSQAASFHKGRSL